MVNGFDSEITKQWRKEMNWLEKIHVHMTHVRWYLHSMLRAAAFWTLRLTILIDMVLLLIIIGWLLCVMWINKIVLTCINMVITNWLETVEKTRLRAPTVMSIGILVSLNTDDSKEMHCDPKSTFKYSSEIMLWFENHINQWVYFHCISLKYFHFLNNK